MTYVHGLGDAQERISDREVETPEGPACPCCGDEMTWNGREQRGSFSRTYVNVFVCDGWDCEDVDPVEVEEDEPEEWDYEDYEDYEDY